MKQFINIIRNYYMENSVFQDEIQLKTYNYKFGEE